MRADPLPRPARRPMRSVLAALVALGFAVPGAAASPMGGHGAMFEVGTPEAPLLLRQPTRTLLHEPGSSSSRPAMAHRSAGAPSAAAAMSASAGAASKPTATSRRCRRLLAARPSRLSRRDRARRAACRKARKPGGTATPAVPATPGVTAPPAPVEGPTPTTAPPGAAEPTPTPAPGSGAPAPVYAAVGVTAKEGGEQYGLTRRTARADIVSFELINTDSQPHDLYIAPADERDEMTGPPVQIVGRTPGQVEGRPTRAATDMRLAPGRYLLLCTVPGHGAMTVSFVVSAPAR